MREAAVSLFTKYAIKPGRRLKLLFRSDDERNKVATRHSGDKMRAVLARQLSGSKA